MTDRELLELAAKAAGIEIDCWLDEDPRALTSEGLWNPLTDDGDAFRLAVKRSIFTEHYELFLRLLQEELAMDRRPSEATRRAIVRAAAEIGRSMK